MVALMDLVAGDAREILLVLSVDDTAALADRARFDAHLARIRTDPTTTNRMITRDGEPVGNIASFVMEGDTELTYWIDRAAWGQGIASRALALFLEA